MTARNRMVMLVGFALGFSACGDIPTRPPQSTITVSPEELATLTAALDDARTRIVPTLADQTVAEDVRQALASGAIALAERDAVRLAGELAAASGDLDRYGMPDGDAPTVESLRLIIAQVNVTTHSAVH